LDASSLRDLESLDSEGVGQGGCKGKRAVREVVFQSTKLFCVFDLDLNGAFDGLKFEERIPGNLMAIVKRG
jgi:hypothetical protein